MSEIALFTSTYCLVFLLGLQSLNVQAGFYKTAFVTSFLIGIMNLVLFKLAPNATDTEIVAYILGGPLGIISSMYFHRNIRSKLKLWSNKP